MSFLTRWVYLAEVFASLNFLAPRLIIEKDCRFSFVFRFMLNSADL